MTAELPLNLELSASIDMTVPFHDADPAGVAWHGNYFRYFDHARCALLDKFDYGYRRMAESGLYWPIVQAEIKYVRPLPYDSRVTVVARLLEWEYRLKIAYEIFGADRQRATSGHTVQVAVNTAGEMQIGAPPILRERLRAWLAREAASR